jgi:hypothetical protein
MPLGIMLYSENQFKKLMVFFFNDGTSIFLKTFLIAKFLFVFFSNLFQTTPLTFDFQNGTTT